MEEDFERILERSSTIKSKKLMGDENILRKRAPSSYAVLQNAFQPNPNKLTNQIEKKSLSAEFQRKNTYNTNKSQISRPSIPERSHLEEQDLSESEDQEDEEEDKFQTQNKQGIKKLGDVLSSLKQSQVSLLEPNPQMLIPQEGEVSMTESFLSSEKDEDHINSDEESDEQLTIESHKVFDGIKEQLKILQMERTALQNELFPNIGEETMDDNTSTRSELTTDQNDITEFLKKKRKIEMAFEKFSKQKNRVERQTTLLEETKVIEPDWEQMQTSYRQTKKQEANLLEINTNKKIKMDLVFERKGYPKKIPSFSLNYNKYFEDPDYFVKEELKRRKAIMYNEKEQSESFKEVSSILKKLNEGKIIEIFCQVLPNLSKIFLEYEELNRCYNFFMKNLRTILTANTYQKWIISPILPKKLERDLRHSNQLENIDQNALKIEGSVQEELERMKEQLGEAEAKIKEAQLKRLQQNLLKVKNSHKKQEDEYVEKLFKLANSQCSGMLLLAENVDIDYRQIENLIFKKNSGEYSGELKSNFLYKEITQKIKNIEFVEAMAVLEEDSLTFYKNYRMDSIIRELRKEKMKIVNLEIRPDINSFLLWIVHKLEYNEEELFVVKIDKKYYKKWYAEMGILVTEEEIEESEEYMNQSMEIGQLMGNIGNMPIRHERHRDSFRSTSLLPTPGNDSRKSFSKLTRENVNLIEDVHETKSRTHSINDQFRDILLEDNRSQIKKASIYYEEEKKEEFPFQSRCSSKIEDVYATPTQSSYIHQRFPPIREDTKEMNSLGSIQSRDSNFYNTESSKSKSSLNISVQRNVYKISDAQNMNGMDDNENEFFSISDDTLERIDDLPSGQRNLITNQTNQSALSQNDFAKSFMYLHRGFILRKYGRFGQPHDRLICIDDKAEKIQWKDPTSQKVLGALNLLEIEAIVQGRNTSQFKRFATQNKQNIDSSFTLEGIKRNLDLEASNPEQKNIFLKHLKNVKDYMEIRKNKKSSCQE